MVNIAYRSVLSGALHGLAALCIASLPSSLLAQVSITSLMVEPLAFPVTSFPMFTVFNAAAPQMAKVELVVTGSKGELVELRSDPFTLIAGNGNYAPGKVRVAGYRTAPDDLGRQVLLQSRIPGGAFDCCLTLYAETGEEIAAPFCEPLNVEDDLWLDLVDPWDGDTVDELRPMLAWTLLGRPTLPDGATARLVLAPCDDGNVARAVANATPHFMVDDLRAFTVPYPAGATDLEPGHCYAWQVEAWRNSALVARSEPWRFCVRQIVDPVPEKYVLLRTDGGKSTYQVVDGFIYFRTDEQYAANSIKCSVLRSDGSRLEPELIRENAGQAVPGTMATGVNLYELDLQPYHLGNGNYALEVEDPKGRRFNMRFSYSK